MEVRTWKLFTAFLCCIGFLLALSRAQREGLTETGVVQFGDLFVLNCSNSFSISGCDIQSTSSLRYDYTDAGPTWKAFTFIVNNWSLSASCIVNCSDNEVSYQETIVTVYQPPESVELEPVPEMEVGKPYKLTCQVSHVAPIRNLTVTLLKGAEQLLVKTFENHTAPEAGTVVVTQLITPQQDDHNKIVTCQASLDLRPRGPFLKNTSHSLSLRSFKPLERMTLELQKLSPGQSWAYNLICRIIRVDPCQSLTVTFFKGLKWLDLPRFTNCTWSEVENCTFTLPVTLHPEDHGQQAYCHAVVRFSLHEPAYQTKSSELPLKTAESHLAIIVAATSAAALLASVLVVFLIFIVQLWLH